MKKQEVEYIEIVFCLPQKSSTFFFNSLASTNLFNKYKSAIFAHWCSVQDSPEP